ncbi:MAG: class I SAM-dependent methyltransferase, partial [Candidatus Marsarchaeota archaeon]|nr:class I SAM-dependent methyltransferase [Candidatus Marsarchaeota archaeon]
SALALGNTHWKATFFYLLLRVDHWGDRIRAAHLFKAVNALIEPGHVVLDAGSGGGAQAFFLARRFPKSRFKGVELSPQSVADCNAILSRLKNRRNLEFESINLLHLESTAEFDVVYYVDVLE